MQQTLSIDINDNAQLEQLGLKRVQIQGLQLNNQEGDDQES